MRTVGPGRTSYRRPRHRARASTRRGRRAVVSSTLRARALGLLLLIALVSTACTSASDEEPAAEDPTSIPTDQDGIAVDSGSTPSAPTVAAPVETSAGFSPYPLEDLVALEAAVSGCREGIGVVSANLYGYPANPASDGSPTWDAVVTALASDHLASCDEVGAFLSERRGDTLLQPAEQALGGEVWTDSFTGPEGLLSLGELVSSSCPQDHLLQLDCVQASASLADAAGDITHVLDLLDVVLTARGDPPSAVETIESVPLDVAVDGGTLTVTDDDSDLAGMTITQMGGDPALETLVLETAAIEAAPPVPEQVAVAFSDVIVVPRPLAHEVRVGFSLADVPEDVDLGDVSLYGYLEDPHDAAAPIWLPIWSDVDIVEADGDARIEVDLQGFGGLAFWGWAPGPPASGTSDAELSAVRMAERSAAKRVAQAPSAVTCTEHRSPVGRGFTVKWTCSTSADPDYLLTIRGWPRNSESFAGTTREAMAGHVFDAFAWLDARDVDHPDRFGVQIASLDGPLGSCCSHGALSLEIAGRYSAGLRKVIHHELGHLVQQHRRVAPATIPYPRGGWIDDGTAEWFANAVDDDGPIRCCARITEAGINSYYSTPTRAYRPSLESNRYHRSTWWMMLSERCPGFADDLQGVFNLDEVVSLASDPSGIRNVRAAMVRWGCDFGDHLGAGLRTSSLEAAISFYNYATQLERRMSLIQADEDDDTYAARLSSPPHVFTGMPTSATANTTPAVLAGVSSVRPAGAYSFVVPAVPGEVPEGQVAELVIDTEDELIVSIASKDPTFEGTNTIGEGVAHRWFATPDTTSHIYGTTIPELFVTVVNPSVAADATARVAVSFRIRGGAAPGPTAQPAFVSGLSLEAGTDGTVPFEGATTWTVTVSNTGAADAPIDALTLDPGEAAFTYVAGTTGGVTSSEPTVRDGLLTWAVPSTTVPAGGSVAVTFDVTPPQTTGQHLVAVGVDGGGAHFARDRVVTVQPPPTPPPPTDGIIWDVGSGETTAGSQTSWQLRLVNDLNDGEDVPFRYSGFTVDLPTGFTYVAGSGRISRIAAEPTISGQVLTWGPFPPGSFSPLSPGRAISLVLQATAPSTTGEYEVGGSATHDGAAIFSGTAAVRVVSPPAPLAFVESEPTAEPTQTEPPVPDQTDVEVPATAEPVAPEGLGTGDVQVTLLWSTGDDLDLRVTDPTGEEISYQRPQSASGGALDVDDRGGCDQQAETRVENVFWQDDAPQGTYQVVIDRFSACGQPTTAFLTVKVGSVTVVDQVVQPGVDPPVTFTVG